MRYVIGPWVWDTTGPHWRTPDGCAGCVDLRSVPQQSFAGGAPSGYGVFALDDPAPDPGSAYRTLGTAPDDTIGPRARGMIGAQLGVGTLGAPRLDSLLYELLTIKADHTGERFARPLMPNRRREVAVTLAEATHCEHFRHDAIQHRAALRQIREQYRANRLAESEGRLPRDHHRRVLDFTSRKLGLDWRALVPPEFAGDPGPLRHRTKITESFNTADSATLGPDLSWTELIGNINIVSNEAKWVASTPAVARADTNLSSDDHYAQVLMPAVGKGSGVACRVADANNMYLPRVGIGSLSKTHIWKRVSGTFTLFHDIVVSAWANADTFKGESNGSLHSIYRNGTLEGGSTDTALSGTLTAGFTLNATGATADNFEAADLVGLIVLRRRREND